MDAWRSDYQATIDIDSTGTPAAARAAERLLRRGDLPAEFDTPLRRNATNSLQPLAALAPSFASASLAFPVPGGWSLFNPSVAIGPAGPRLVVRSANYTFDAQMRYTIHDAAGIIRTMNYLVDLGPDLQMASAQAIHDGDVRAEPPAFLVSGFEDLRLIWRDGSWWASATWRDGSPAGICQLVLLRLEGARVAEVIPLSDGVTTHEKNWMPVVSPEPHIDFVYSVAPTVVLRFDLRTHQMTALTERQAPPVARLLRGGGQILPVAGGWLGLAHESVALIDGGRVYYHRWLRFDERWRLTDVSPQFFLRERGVEFAAGLAAYGDELLVTYGVRDREAWLGRVATAEVLGALEPARDPASPERLTPGFTPARHTPIIAATTLSGNAADTIGDALRSVVDWVDWCIVIDTGITDATLEVARQVAGDKLVVRQFPWRDDFSSARNFALQAAADVGAAWAVTVDTDERMLPNGVDIAAALATMAADTVHVQYAAGSYGKERFVRLPSRGTWAGPTHEAFVGPGMVETLPGVAFRELGKSAAQYRLKAERDVRILTRHVAEHPDDPRWRYYLGDSLSGLERNEEAVEQFRACTALRGWDEESAWAMFRAAECLLAMGRPAEAVEACATGVARHAGLAELPWLAAFASWRAGLPAQAVYWARLSVVQGLYAGAGASVPRIGFRHTPALWEGPFDVLRYALRSAGDDEGADEAERHYQAALAARQEQEQEG
ncbi:MAG: glycosyltransferase [Thermomicrobiales bacterium]